MTEQERAEWQQRLEAAVAETLRQRQARRQLREQHQAARDIGLRHRHAARLAHAQGDAMPTTEQPPACCRDSGHPDGCPQHAQYAWEALRIRRRRRPLPTPTTPPTGPDAPEAGRRP